MSRRPPSPLLVIVAAAAWLADLPVLHAVLAGADRGLDAMDESHYLMAAQPWASDKAFNGVFGWYSGPLLRLAGGDLGRFRVYAAVLLVVAGLVMAGAVRRGAEELGGRAWPGWLVAVWPPATVAAALCYYTVFVRTPSYNWFAAVGLMLLAAGLLQVLTLDRPGRGAALAGAMVATGAFITAIGKATTAVGALGVLLLAAVVHTIAHRHSRAVLQGVGVAVASAVVSGGLLAALHVTVVHSPAVTIATYRRVSGMLSAVDPGHYAPGVALATARLGLRNVLVDRPWSYLPLLVLPVLAAASLAVLGTVRHRGAWLGAVHAVVWWLVLVLVLSAYPGGVPGLGMSVSPLVIAAEAALVVALLSWILPAAPSGDAHPPRPPARRGTAVLACAALLAMGAAYPLGTNVEYATQLPGGFPVLLAAAAIGVSALPDVGSQVALGSLAVGALLLGAILVPTTRALAPYRIAPLAVQTIPRVIVTGTPPVLVDAQTARWVDALRADAARAGFAPGTPMLDLTWHPASVLVLDGRAPSVLLPAFPGWPDPAGSAAYALRQEDRAVWNRAWLLVPVIQDDALTDGATVVVGRRFPSGYERVGVVIAPYDRQVQGLWRPR